MQKRCLTKVIEFIIVVGIDKNYENTKRYNFPNGLRKLSTMR